MKNFSRGEKFLMRLQASTLHVPSMLIFSLCFVLTILATHYAYQNYRSDQLARFERLNTNIVSSIEQRFEVYVNALFHTRSFFEVSPNIDLDTFEELLNNLKLREKYRGIRGIGYLPKVPTRNLKSFEKKIAMQELSDFKIFPLNASGHGDIAFPLTHYYPLENHRNILGIDPYSEPTRRQIMDLAKETGLPASTGLVSFANQQSEEGNGFVVYVPSYKRGMPLLTAEQREKALMGFIVGTVRTDYFFDFLSIIHRFAQNQLHLAVFDGAPKENGNPDPKNLIFETANRNQIKDTVFFEKITRTSHVQFANINWTVQLTTLPPFFAPGWWRLPLFVFVFGSIVSVVLTLTIILSKNQSRMLMKDIALRKAAEQELKNEKKIVELTSKIGLNLKAESDLKDIVQMVTDTATEVTKAEFGAFFYNTLDENGETITAHAFSGIVPSALNQFTIPNGTKIFETTFDKKEFTRAYDITEDPQYDKMGLPYLGVPSKMLLVRSFLAAPVKSLKTDEIIGGLFFGHSERGIFTENSEKALKSICAHAGVAIDNATLYSQLTEAQEAAESANKAKSNFLANMSHEIRTPLGVILGYTDLALEQHSQFPENLHEYLTFIKKNGEELTRIIGEVLDLAKIEANKMEIEKTQFNLHTFLNDVLSFLNLRAREKGILLSLSQDLNTPQYIVSDPTRLRQIITNLVGNAIKFTEKGAITLHVKLLKSSPEELHLCFAIEDTGIGISNKQKEKLFMPFSQADNSITRKYGGTGLGLLLSKQLSNAMGGDLVLQRSELGKGSLFEFNIIAYPPKDEQKNEKQVQPAFKERSPELEGKKILIVEDSEDNQVLLKYYLKHVNLDIQLAKNGEEGVAITKEYNPDLVLMDIQMPVMDGYSATKELRSWGYDKPIIALTAHALNEDRERALQNGFNDYLTKPLDRKLLLNALKKYLAGENDLS